MITEIGITAGDIWHYLDKHESATLDQLVKGINKSNDLILMSLGWLAREGHVTLGDHKTGYLTRLSVPKH
ncbi:MAG: winged helix-turn-helix domain-containing protein [Candidatus Omnitrophica bacterium]|nr:winged helix-turn-helix domain-containing protein [Candidatus Omnitrophota bacterium]